MAAANKTGKGEIVFGLAMLVLMPAVQDFLTALPHRSTDERLVNSLIYLATIFELAGVDELT